MAEVVNHVFGLNEVYSKINRGAWPAWIDAVPDQFTFTDQTGVQLSATITSNTITVSGITTGTPIIIAGGTYSINAGTYTSANGTVNNGDTVTVRHTSSASVATAVNTVLSIGEVSDTFTSITLSGDTVPDTFSFNAAPSVEPSTTTTSNTVTITGLIGPSPISVTGGTYSINGGAYTSAAGTITNNATLTLRHVSSASYSSATTTTVNIGGVTAQFISTTRAIDTTPNVFSFSAVTGVTPSLNNSSNQITVAGLDSGAVASVTITGGTYIKNGAAQSSAATTAVNGDTFYVTGQASASYSTTTSVVLTIGGINGTYNITTRAADTVPNAFSFTSTTGADPSSVNTSNTITLSGMDAGQPASVSITGGTYSKNGGTYTSATGTAVNGDTFTVRGTASASNNTTTNVVLTVGGISGTYSITTVAPSDTTPDPFTFTNVTGASLNTAYISNTVTIAGLDTSVAVSFSGTGTYSKNGGTYTSAAGTAVNGDTFNIRIVSPNSYSSSFSGTLTVGTVSDAYSVQTRAANTTPNAFSLGSASGVEPGSENTSNTITVAGMDTGQSASVSISGTGTYSKNGGAYTNASGTALNGNTFTVKNTASSSFSTANSTTLNIGGRTGSFGITTRAANTTPTTFSYTKVTGAEPNTDTASNTWTVSGMDTGAVAAVSITGGTYSKNGGAFTSAAGTAVNGDTLVVRITSSSTYSTSLAATIVVGGFSNGSFAVTTKIAPVTSFSFTAVTGAPKGTSTYNASNAVTISGLAAGANATLTVTGTGATTEWGIVLNNVNRIASTSGTTTTVVNGDVIKALRRPSASANTTETTTVSIGNVNAVYSVTSGA